MPEKEKDVPAEGQHLELLANCRGSGGGIDVRYEAGLAERILGIVGVTGVSTSIVIHDGLRTSIVSMNAGCS